MAPSVITPLGGAGTNSNHCLDTLLRLHHLDENEQNTAAAKTFKHNGVVVVSYRSRSWCRHNAARDMLGSRVLYSTKGSEIQLKDTNKSYCLVFVSL